MHDEEKTLGWDREANTIFLGTLAKSLATATAVSQVFSQQQRLNRRSQGPETITSHTGLS